MSPAAPPARPLSVLPLPEFESLLPAPGPGECRDDGLLAPPLLVTDEDSAVLVDGSDPGLCPG